MGRKGILMSVNATLTEAVRESIQIDSFIYHIIRKDAEKPDYTDAVKLNSEQKIFFEERIQAACDGTQFAFSAPENNSCKEDCEQILGDVDGKFKELSKRLTLRFFDAHNKSMSDGVFIVAVISVLISGERRSLLSFLKVDFSTVYQQKVNLVEGESVVSLERVIDSLADSTQSLQKWAIVDPSDLFAWDVLASQRGITATKKDTEVAISKYFRSFLQVHVRENASTLTRSSISEAGKWARSLTDLPTDMIRSDFRARAVNYFENNENFDTDSFIDQVLGAYVKEGMSEEESQARKALRESHRQAFRETLAEAGIAGQVFESKPSSIPNANKTTTLKTRTGLKLIFQGQRDQHNIEIIEEGNEKVITIRTSHFDEE